MPQTQNQTQMPPGYYNTFKPTDNYEEVLIRAGKVAQSQEPNIIQSMMKARLRGISDALFKDGDVIRDAQVIVNAETGHVLAESGAIYLSGAVRGIPEAEFDIAVSGIVTVGVYLQTRVISELEDPSLLDPALGTRNHMKPGGHRLQVTPSWGFSGDGQAGDFYAVYTIEDGVLRAKDPPPQLDSVTQALAAYDRDSAGGTYVVEGMLVIANADTDDGRQSYTLTEGRARVHGYGVTLPTSKRILYDAAPDSRFIDAEPHLSATAAAQRVNTDRSPIGEITQVKITAEKTATITHGSYTGVADPLPDPSVLAIVSVSQGGTTYAYNSDYKLTAGAVDWSPTGAEPSPGSTYSVTYQHIKSVAPAAADATGFTVTGALPGSQILVSYTHLLPRIDRLAMTSEGEIRWVKGVAADYNPLVPYMTNDLLPLATIRQDWTPGASGRARQLSNDSVRTVTMPQLFSISDALAEIRALVALQRLEASANLKDSSQKKGLFVDPFLDDSGRDMGIEQTAMIANEELSLRIDADAHQLVGDLTAPETLPTRADLPVSISQTLKTGTMKINPYQAFAPIPNQVKLTPSVDRWTSEQKIVTGSREGSWTGFVTTGQSRTQDAFLRSIPVAYEIRGWEPGEVVAQLKFDDLPVTPTGQSNSNGVCTGSFTIPTQIPVGTKSVWFLGTANSVAQSTFTGSGETLTIYGYEQWRPPITFPSLSVDPLAQTFQVPAACQIAAVDLTFSAIADNPVVVQIRSVENGVPNREVLAQQYVYSGDIVTTGAPTRIVFDAPVYLQAGAEYALVIMSDDAEPAVAIAELGKYDTGAGVWVTQQPYQIGVLLSSSNASTWTAHQDRDLTFRLLAAQYAATTREVALGAVQVTDATDLMLFVPAERPESEARVSYRLSIPAATAGDQPTVLIVDSGQHVQLATPRSGEVTVTALLSGSQRIAPVIYPGAQLVVGQIATTGDYVSRGTPAGQDAAITVIYDALLPAGASVTPSVSGIDADDAWLALTQQDTMFQDDGFIEFTWGLAGLTEAMLRVKLDLAGTPAARPRVRNLRVIVT